MKPHPARVETLWLVLPLALVLVPHALQLPAWLPLAWLALAGWRVWLAGRPRPTPPRWLLALVALAGVAGVFLQFGTVFGPQGGVALVVFLSGAKLLETANARDQVGLIFVGYFLLVAHFLNEQTLLTATYMLAALVVLTAALIASQMPEPGRIAPKLKRAGWLLLQALPLAALLFVLFPRISGPLWGLTHETVARTGLSDRMSPGDIAELIQSDATAFRARFDRPGLAASQLYWRGPVFWDYDGRTWQTRGRPPEGALRGAGLGEPLRYEIILEPHQQRWLFLLGFPEQLPPLKSRLGPDLQWLAQDPVYSRLQYAVSSHLDYRLEPELDARTWVRALDLPEAGNPRARALARTWRGQGLDDAGVVRAALRRFRDEPYVYTLRPPRLGPEAIDDFLFGTRRGFCEHYASAFTFLMRAAGIPARIVTGYQGGEYNPVGDFWLVRQRDAHAWAEVWLPEQGWVRVDPTAAIAPERVERGLDAALPEAELPGGLARLDIGWLTAARQSWEALNYRWNYWVLGYNDLRQRELLARLNPALATLQGMLWALAIGASVTLFALAALLLLRRPARSDDPAMRAYERFCRRLARLGIVRAPGEGPNAFARRLLAHPQLAAQPQLHPAIARITALYTGLRYGSAPRDTLKELEQAVREFRPRRGRP